MQAVKRGRAAEVAPKQRTKPKAKPRGKPWPKGTSGNAGGRPAGYREWRELCRDRTPDALEALSKAMRGGGAAAVAAARFIIETAWGRAPAPPTEAQVQAETPSVFSTLTRDELVALASMPTSDDPCRRCGHVQEGVELSAS